MTATIKFQNRFLSQTRTTRKKPYRALARTVRAKNRQATLDTKSSFREGTQGNSGKFRGHITSYVNLRSFGGRPPFCGFSTRPTLASRRSMNVALPSGRPVRPCSRKFVSSSSRIALSKKPRQSATIANSGATFVSRSSRPNKCALALLQGHSSALFANFARTGFNSTYRAAASRCGSSMIKEAKRPCHRKPRHFSRKLIRRV